MNWKRLEGLGWSVGTAIATAFLLFFSSPDNLKAERLQTLPAVIIPAGAGAGLAWLRGLKTDPADFDKKE